MEKDLMYNIHDIIYIQRLNIQAIIIIITTYANTRFHVASYKLLGDERRGQKWRSTALKKSF